MSSRVAWFGISLALTAALLGIWQVAADLRWVSPIFFPSPARIWSAFLLDFNTAQLVRRILLTLAHIAEGWLAASVLGICIGAVIGCSESARAYVEPLLEFFRPLPASAIFPIAIPVFGLTEGMMIFVIAFGAIWPTLLATASGFWTVKVRLTEVARLVGLGPGKYIRYVALPNATPEILAGMRLSFTIALLLSVLGEMLSGSDGLGRWILLQARSFRTPDLFAGVLIFGVIGYVSAAMLSALERHALRWRGSGP